MASTSTCDRVGHCSPQPSLSTYCTLKPFRKAAQPSNPAMLEEESTSIVNIGCVARTRQSLASVLEMMSTTLAVATLRFQQHGPVCSTPRAVRRHHPFPSLYSDSRPIYAFFRDRTPDDLTVTERAACTRSDAWPQRGRWTGQLFPSNSTGLRSHSRLSRRSQQFPICEHDDICKVVRAPSCVYMLTKSKCHQCRTDDGKAPTRVSTNQAHQPSGWPSNTSTHRCIGRQRFCSIRRPVSKAVLASTASEKQKNSLETVAVGPMEEIPPSSDENMVVAVSFYRAHAYSRFWTFQNQLAAALASARFASAVLQHSRLLLYMIHSLAGRSWFLDAQTLNDPAHPVHRPDTYPRKTAIKLNGTSAENRRLVVRWTICIWLGSHSPRRCVWFCS